MTTKEKQSAYKLRYRMYLKAKRENDPWSKNSEIPDPADYGLTGKQGEWLADKLRKEVENE